MKHATPSTIERLAPLLAHIRLLAGLEERKPGIFYRRSRAFLHFHEHGDDVFADVRLDGGDFQRLPCTNQRDQAALVIRIRKHLQS